MRISRTAFLIGITMSGGCAAPDEAEAPADPTVAQASRHGDEDCDWPQWGSDPAHTGQACKGTRRLKRIIAHRTFDPFTEEEKAVFGPDWFAYGIEPNRPSIEALLQYTHEHGLTDRRVKLEELFVPSTLRDIPLGEGQHV